MRKPKRVIGYVCDIPIPGTDEVISKNDQKARMLKYAQKEGIEVVTIYEDEAYTADFMSRPGVQRVLNCNEPYDQVMVERVWCFTRSRKELDAFMVELDKKGVQLGATSYLWDCLSQQVRHRYMGTVAEKARELMKTQKAGKDEKAA